MSIQRFALLSLFPVALFGGLVACCGPATPKLEPEAEHVPAPAPTRGKLEAADSLEQKDALARVEKVTGLKFKAAFPVYVFTPEELAAEMAEWKEEGDGRDHSNVMGFYKSDTKAMYLVPEVAGNKRAFGLRVHEATHALQDQHFGLMKLHTMAKTADEQLAMTALIEGHAVQVMIDALIETNPGVEHIAKVPEPADPRAPGAITVFSYAAGTRFIRHLKEHGLHGKKGYEAVHLAFKHPPVSPEEIRSPEQYLARVAGK